MSESPSDAYALLESSFAASPNLRSHKQFPRRSDDYRRLEPAARKEETLLRDDETESQASSELPTPTPLAPQAPAQAESGLPPTPPSNSQDGLPATDYSPPPHADSLVNSLTSRKSTLSTPVNQRSPPTPDPSPPRRATASMTTPERPVPFTYPSSRAESFTTAREEPISSETESRSSTPVGARLSVVEEDRGLGLAFEREEDDTTPRNTVVEAPLENEASKMESGLDGQGDPDVEDIPNREWDTNLMRNVTVRRKRNTKPSPKKKQDVPKPASPAASPVAGSTPRRSSSLRERVEASRHSPHTASIENFAKAINWPIEAVDTQTNDPGQKRFSASSMASTVVEAMVVVTPSQPQRRHTLRHSGKNLAYRQDTDSPIESGTTLYSRTSMRSDDVPLHRLVHKRASIKDRGKRNSSDSATMYDRTATPASLRQRAEESAAVTLAHQRSIKSVLQPAADIMSWSNSVTRNQPSRNSHKRIASAPEAVTRTRTPSISHSTFDMSPPESPSPRRQRKASSRLAHVEVASPASPDEKMHDLLLPKLIRKNSPTRKNAAPNAMLDVNKSLPEIPLELPIQHTDEIKEGEDEVHDPDDQSTRPTSAMLERVRHLLASTESTQPTAVESPQIQENLRDRASSTGTVPNARRGSLSARGRSEERRSSLSQDRTSNSQDALLRPSLDRVHTEELPRSSHEWHSFHTDENGRVSFDRTTTKSDEHAMARHLFSQTTPFSQFSDTPIEVSEATAVSIYPHNNNSLLVVQQVARASQQPQEHEHIANEAHYATPNVEELEEPSTPPFFDASEGLQMQLQQPTLTFEPSTPPMQIELPTFTVVDSPLKNPRKPPEPPVIKFIPPTPAEELERQLVPGPPGPPKQSDSHPQRRLSLKQRARRYSDNFISPFLARASSMRGRSASVSHHGHGQVHIPTVNDEDGSLHPFWRPRGFWDGFEDSDSESDEGYLPRGGDTSDVEDSDSEEPPSPRKLGALGRRLTNKVKKPNGFLIGNSLGVERSGTNRRKPHINLPSRGVSKPWPRRESPKILIQPPTLPFRRSHSARIQKRPSRTSMASSSTHTLERPRRRTDRGTWRQGKSIPGLKNMQVQYIGLSGVKERFREKRAERRREALRKSIGGRWYVEPGTPGGTHLHT
ncbi:uncharacterized protein N0V89_007294 [Didymosphaeria variabile]|uniref:Uncharacterized protein n=1 Tax=Didymosphaeria variabile TaxID=1932322 RepID=A0A9W8XIW2_9PLEO|nr:uncharacterized protein N0V89_007294 [Didymosphaeria variabile]KAJ4351949.1 hypothetical protein N0V89_007294 [Didymosphaeria variabile]